MADIADPALAREGRARIDWADAQMPVLRSIAERFAGFFSLMPVLRDSFIGAPFDQGYPERYPRFEQLESGEVVVRKDEVRKDELRKDELRKD